MGLSLVLLTLPPLVYYSNPALGLLVGTALTLALNRPLLPGGRRLGRLMLQSAIVLLGLKLHVADLWQISARFIWLVIIYVSVTLSLGLLLGRVAGVDRTLSRLIASGTAICGGTTIATLAPILKARADQVGVALAIVFLLNALALFTFPAIGHWLEMTQTQFGVWVSLAIHDTSSVVATAQIYGDEAASVATTVKLGRTLWLIPLVVVVSLQQKETGNRIQLPVFVLLFVIASVLGSVIALPAYLPGAAGWLSKSLLVGALFFVGTEITRDTVQRIRGRVVWQAIGLWLLVIPATLFAALAIA